MRKAIYSLACLWVSCFLLPFVCAVLLEGGVILTGHMSAQERILPILLSTEISSDYPRETIKAQGVIARTNYRIAGKEQKLEQEIYAPILEYYDRVRKKKILWNSYCVCKVALEDTVEYMTYQGEARWAPYHRISNGTTRDGQEVLGSPDYSYLVSVESAMDRESEDYITVYTYPGDYLEEMEVLKNDSAGYVSQVRTGGMILSGEELRRQLRLASCDFNFQENGGDLRVVCQGQGHGLGLSQYGASVLAQKGRTYIEILNYYFPQMMIHE